ncbi:NCS2 family permease [Porphyromonas circumdentaria]|uniref:Putative MFS transporter, AGZA family, xanthine/uracil permease n=1 Tax=Porphyromonas circumdentaria TaxID=29524 RepID=A0A1T4PCM7_9PORP|nr:NCS2 family permease [Porphyromonas circumdentaria]MBB6276387.1 AGZA family xanthine/uracil permease-like MFS transporter [Porphyromonas circumdentaria]MDO4722917.1 NCS2 family permease [Porphyromonas circumdentaria]SJZ89310.1 putative MFS transporter, AGZA family, xanthine/uracil permease [Porphyromonas circumdentaria]
MNFLKLLGFSPERHKVRTELVAGLTTFLTMSYILAVNPSILSATGMDKGAVFTATALASAIGTILIAFFAKLPFAQAPSMGINAFFAFTLVLGMGYSWEAALTAVFVEGIIFILLTAFNIREQIVRCIPKNLRFAISAGIGMFIAFIGLKNAGIIVANEATFVTLGKFTPTAILASLGIIVSAVLIVLKVRGALFYGIIICTLAGIPLGVTNLPDGFVPISTPQSLAPTFLKFDFAAIFNMDMMLTIFALVFMDIFNTIGTLIGAAANTEMMDENGNVKNVKAAMMADAVATSAGAMLGTSTVTTFVESASGIAEGGRTGLTSFTTAMLFLLALFFSPLFLLIPAAATTGALVLVGVFMLSAIQEIDLSDMSEALPSFITMITMVLTYNIAEGMALGLISYTLVKLLSGQYKQVSVTLYIVTALLILRYILQ